MGLEYALLSRLIHRPSLLRVLATWIPKLPFLGVVSTRSSVKAALRRGASFSNTAHHTDLPRRIDFVIGMDRGPRQDADRKFLIAHLACPKAFGDGAAARSRECFLRLQDVESFDLVDDYLLDVVWAAMRTSFRDAAPAIETFGVESAGCPFTKLYSELRYVGAQLIGGAKAPKAVQRRAQEKADALNDRVAHCETAIASAWKTTVDGAMLRRNAVGLMWVGHPATVQAAALIMQNLLRDRTLYEALRKVAAGLGEDAWADPDFRKLLWGHVLEQLRFSPPFPILNRDVPRRTLIDADGREKWCKAGATVQMMSIGAMFEIEDAGTYSGTRPDSDFEEPDDRFLMFGSGDRSCIAKEQVVQTLVSALVGLLRLPPLHYEGGSPRIVYDGPIITHMRLRR